MLLFVKQKSIPRQNRIVFMILSSLLSLSRLPLYIISLVCLFYAKPVCGSLQIVPHFTSLPDPITQFVTKSNDNDDDQFHFELVCRAWPPNAKLYLLANQLSSVPVTAASSSPAVGQMRLNDNMIGQFNMNNLTPLPKGLGNQRFGIVTSLNSNKHATNQITPDSRRTNQNSNSNEIVDSNTKREQSSNALIVHETLLDAVRDRPAAEVTDEIGVRLIIDKQSEMMRLELMRMHCIVGTLFGRVLSAPFKVVPSTLGQFPLMKSNKLPSSSSGTSSSYDIENVEFLRGNVAIVDCYPPLNSYLKPVIEFELNNTLLEIMAQSDKYRQVNRPDGKRVSLLINNFQSRDCGVYRCVATNPLTKEKKYSPDAVNLKIIKPESPVPARIRVPLASKLTDSQNSPTTSQEISVNEGDNVTLFCVIQSAPPPMIATYPFDKNFTAHPRFHPHSSFGLLEIVNVQPSDAGIYICSDRQISSTAQLHVRARLRLTTKPQDVYINRFGETAQFKCTTSDHHITPYWLFNGKPKIIGVGKDHTLTISNVTNQDLGIYQCIAQKSSSADSMGPDEWLSAVAILALQSDKIILTANELSSYTPSKPNTPVETVHDITTNELIPVGEPVYDNLAVYITWEPYQKANGAGPNPAAGGSVTSDGDKSASQVAYRLDYSMQYSPIEKSVLQNTNFTNNLLMKSTNTDPDQLPALIGLVGYDAIKWSDPVSLNQQFSTPYTYVTGEPLEPGRRYRFRVTALDPSSGIALAPPSGWSNIVGMEHISKVEPPQIKIVRPMTEGRVHVVWMFNGIGGQLNNGDTALLHGSSSSNPTATSTTTTTTASTNRNEVDDKKPQQQQTALMLNPSGQNDGLQQSVSPILFDELYAQDDQFVADHFLILARPVIKPKRRGGTSSIEYGAYWATQINGSNTREGVLSGLNSSAHYQIIVYGVSGDGLSRQITRFSKAVYVNMASTDHTGRYSLLETLSNNRLMYFILGGIAGLMFLVMFVLILLCLCRQHQARRHTSQRKKQNGYVKGYKDTTGFHNMDNTTGNNTQQQQQQPNGPATKHAADANSICNQQQSMNHNTNSMNNNNNTNTLTSDQAMYMGNLQCNPMSEQSMTNHQHPHMMMMMMSPQHQNELQQQQQQLTMQRQQQQQQMDQYNSSMSKEMFHQQQQRQAMMGSQLQLHPNHPLHHQSHHSLLLPPNCGNMVSPHHQHQMMMMAMSPPPANMFHSGTLPGGPRYLRQQQAYSAHFGSQQPLNRSSTPANAIEMTEFYNHHHQHHQQQQQLQSPYTPYQAQLPPVPHPQSAGLPPPYPTPSNGTINRQLFAQQQQQMYYPGTMTPSGASLRREPPTGGGGGSIQDGSAYGTLLQRGQLTSSMMTDPSVGGGVGGSNMDAVYYHGSQQALHMYPSGMTTPQQQQHAMYMQQQQQQQQGQMYPGCFSPQPTMHPHQPSQQQHFDMTGHGHPGQMHTDGESVYSYFSQHDMNQLGPAQHLNTLPEENQINPNDAMVGVGGGTQNTDGNEHHTPGTDGSPNTGHRHHRRRRRKQQQQQHHQQQQPSQQLERQNEDHTDGTQNNDREDSMLIERYHHQQQQQHHHQSQSIIGSKMDLAAQQQQQNALPQHHLSESDNKFSESTGQINDQQVVNISPMHPFVQMDGTNMNSRYMRYDSPQRVSLGVGQLPPPNQPPPPPPPPAVAMGFASPNLNSSNHNDQSTAHQNPMSFQNHYLPDSLSRRACSPPHAMPTTGLVGGGTNTGCYSSGSGTGLLVGPPPRIRDYSEYGIPRGVGLPPTPSGVNQASATAAAGTVSSMHQHHHLSSMGNLNNGGTYFDDRYREGQA